MRGWLVASLQKYTDNTNALQEELKSNYRQIVSSFEDTAGSVRFNTFILILFFSVSLFTCFTGLFQTESRSGGIVWVYIALSLIWITSAMLYFSGTWDRLQTLSNDLNEDFLSLTVVSNICDDAAEDAKNSSDPKTPVLSNLFAPFLLINKRSRQLHESWS